MNITDIFKENGIGDDIAGKILEAMKANGIYLSAEENIDVRYGKLKTQHDTVSAQLKEANGTIEALKQSNAGNEELQKKVTDYEQTMQTMQTQLEQVKRDAALQVKLHEANATDVNYMTFCLNEKLKKDGKALELDESGDIKGWDELLSGLQTQFPTFFDSAKGKDGLKVYDPAKLKKSDENRNPTREEFKNMGYNERVALKNENPELFKQLAN